MEFRWVIFITLWTFLGGPVFHSPPQASPPAQEQQTSAVRRAQPDPKQTPLPRSRVAPKK